MILQNICWRVVGNVLNDIFAFACKISLKLSGCFWLLYASMGIKNINNISVVYIVTCQSRVCKILTNINFHEHDIITKEYKFCDKSRQFSAG